MANRINQQDMDANQRSSQRDEQRDVESAEQRADQRQDRKFDQPQDGKKWDEQSDSRTEKQSRDFADTDSQRNRKASTDKMSRSSDIQHEEQLGGRSAGGNAGTAGVSTNDVGNSRASKSTRLER